MSTNNEINVVKSKVLSIVASLQNIEDERDQMKAVIESLKAEHGIEPKIARKAAKLLHSNKLQEFNDDLEAVQSLLEKVNLASK